MITSTVAAALLCALLCHLLIRAAAAGWRGIPLAYPNRRTLHDGAVPRVGGVAIWIAIAALAGADLARTDALAPALLAVALISLADDMRGIWPPIRLAVHLAAALWFAGAWSSGAAMMSLAIVLAAAANLTNFMDGANGLVGGVLSIALATLCLASGDAGALAGLTGVGAAAIIGFLPFNAPSGRLFMGDVGAVALGFFVAAVGWIGIDQGRWNAALPLLATLPLWVDAILTMSLRALRREHIWLPHRQHVYQRLVQCGWSHGQVAATYCAIALAGSALGGLVRHHDQVTAMWTVLAAATVAAGVYGVAYQATQQREGSQNGFRNNRA